MTYPLVIHTPNRDFAYPLERNLLAIRAKTARKALTSLTLVTYDARTIYSPSRMPKKRERIRHEMKCYARDNLYDYYEAEVQTPYISEFVSYYFEAATAEGVYWVNSFGFSSLPPKTDLFQYKYTNINDVFRVPEWPKGTVYYQVFPERFFNGDPSNDPEGVEPWGSVPTRTNFMGGDLKGIIQKTGYLAELGIDTLYLTPVFQSSTNHKYDTIDYFKIDPSFGTNEDFRQLVAACHSKGIRVVIDGVFNHCGCFFGPFTDVVKNGAASPYRDWFLIESYPVSFDPLNYESFGNGPGMPKINYACKEARDYILKAVRYWIEEADIDGWRLDVADEIDHSFLEEIRKNIKAVKPDCVIIGETWIENTDMLRGDATDSVMNYLFRNAALSFFAEDNGSSAVFDALINRWLGIYPRQTHHLLYNLLDSHDTARFLTLACESMQKMKAAVAFQFCCIGSPAVYYGDEAGMTGENDPGCRKAMVWDPAQVNQELFEWYKRLIALRKEHRALATGDFCSIYCTGKDNVYGFCRSDENERLYIAVNGSDRGASVELPLFEECGGTAQYRDLLGGETYQSGPLGSLDGYNADIHPYAGAVRLTLSAYQTCVLKKC